MNPWSIHADGIAALQSEAGKACPQIFWGNAYYNLLPGSARLKLQLQEGGFDQDYDLTATALLATFLNGSTITNVTQLQAAMQKTTFTYLGINYRFQSVWLLPGGFQIQINANAAKK